MSNSLHMYTRRTRLGVLTVLIGLIVGVALSTSSAYATTPRVTVKEASTSLVKCVRAAHFSVTSSASGTYSLRVTDARGRLVYAQKTAIARYTRTMLKWNGRASADNQIGKKKNDLVASGTYNVALKVTAKTGSKTIKRTVKAKATPTPSFSSVTASTSGTPSTVPGAHAFYMKACISTANDVVLTVTDANSGARVAQQVYRSVTPRVLRAYYWDGQVDYAGSVTLPSGLKAIKGDVAPPATYNLTLSTRGKSVTRRVTVKPTPPSRVTVQTSTATLQIGAHTTLVASVYPRGASETRVTWSSSNKAIATVSSKGVVTAQTKEGRVTITATAVGNATAKASVTLNVFAPSTLRASGIAVTKWCQYQQSKSLYGHVLSNTPISWVEFTIKNSSGAKEITKRVIAGDSRYHKALTDFNVKTSMDAYIAFAKLTPGHKTLVVTARDTQTTRTVYTQTFDVLGPTRLASFWKDRVDSWVYPLDVKNTRNVSWFGTYRSGGTRAHAAIDLLEPAGTRVYSMTDGVVEAISTTFYAGTGAVQIKNSDGSVMRYCEVKPVSGLKVGDRVVKNQRIATIVNNSYGTSMLHLEAYSGTAKGALTQTGNMTYTNVVATNYGRRSDLLYPMGVLLLEVPASRTIP